MLRLSTCTTANGIPRLEADDMMELREAHGMRWVCAVIMWSL